MDKLHQLSYSQGQTNRNLLRLLLSLEQAKIPHLLLEPIFDRTAKPIINQPQVDRSNSDQPNSDATIDILFSEQGLAKFYQVFVGQRFVQIEPANDRSFWDSRTGLTLRIFLPSELQNNSQRVLDIALLPGFQEHNSKHENQYYNQDKSRLKETRSFQASVNPKLEKRRGLAVAVA